MKNYITDWPKASPICRVLETLAVRFPESRHWSWKPDRARKISKKLSPEQRAAVLEAI